MPYRNKSTEKNDSSISPSKQVLTSGQLIDLVSKRTGKKCTLAMINNYLRKGLIPTPQRSGGGFRLFKISDVARVIRIKQLQEEGLSLLEIKEQFDNGLEIAHEELQIADLPVNRREQILEAAAKIFPQKGYSETTFQDIAQEIGISGSAIYQYFRSKEELFLTLTERLSFLDVLEKISSTLDYREHVDLEDIRQALIDIAGSALFAHQSNAEIFRLLISEARRFPEIGTSFYERQVAKLEALLERFVAYQISQGVFRKINARLAANGFIGMFLNFVVIQNLLYSYDPDSFPAEEHVPELVDMFLRGVIKDLRV